jgi:uncharacterized damage-inducible protein DinB
MSTREFFIKRWEAELPAFGKVLRAVPETGLGYRPHERSTAAGALAWQIADEQAQLLDLLKSGVVKFADRPKPPAKVTDIVAEWDRATEDLRKRLQAANDKKWSEPAKLLMGESEWSDTMENMFWGYLFDMVHHRGQLSAYLRPMGGKVPAIYGPSADDSGA